jgi:hypothetical protein
MTNEDKNRAEPNRSTRFDLSRRNVLKGAAATGVGLSGLGAFAGGAAAASGDVLATVTLPNTGSGVGLTFTGEYVMVVDGFGSTEIDIYTPPSGTGSATHVATKTVPNAISGIEWDPTRERLWATYDGDPFWSVDIGDPTTTGAVSAMTSEWSAPSDSQGWPADGTAYDARDDTIWWSKDGSVDPTDGKRKVWKLDATDGSLVRKITPKVNASDDLFPQISGVALGADRDGRPTLYLGSNPSASDGNIVRVYADGDAEWISNFATGTDFRVEDLACDPLTYAPNESLIVKDSNFGEYQAFEVEPGTCLLPKLQVPVDIKPRSCPNPMNVKSKGVLPVAILGTADFDVSEVDPSTVTLEGVSPLRWNYEDVAAPFEPYVGKEESDDCTTAGPDGFMDLTLKFDTEELVAALDPEPVDGETRVLSLDGELSDGREFRGEDVVVIKKKGK